MKNIKRFWGVLLVMSLLFALAACSQKEETADTGTMDISDSASTTEEAVTNDQTTAETDETTAAEEVSIESLVKNYFSQMPDNVYKISQSDFVQKVINGDDMVIIDIRGAADYEAGHIKGAINLPWGTAISDGLAYIPQDKEVFIYCYTGQTAGQAVVTLNVAGINTRSVNLGWNLGISKVEGVDAVTETTANALGTEKYPIDENVQQAMDAYYAGLADVSETNFKNYKVSEDNLKAMIDNSEDFYLLSVRKAEDYAAGHIKGAKNVPFNNTLIDNIGSLPKDKTVVVYCYTGQTAGQTTAALRLLGYDAVSLNGGMGMASNAPSGWANKGYEVVTD